jgi:hypothetical protein
MGLPKPQGELATYLPLAAIPGEVHDHLLGYAWKIACAIYYREQGRPASREHFVWATWTQGANRRGVASLDSFYSDDAGDRPRVAPQYRVRGSVWIFDAIRRITRTSLLH